MADNTHNSMARCGVCLEGVLVETVVTKDVTIRHDGKLYTLPRVRIPAEECSHCKTVAYGLAADDAKQNALREHLGLLKPQEILAARLHWNLTQEDVYRDTNLAEETVSRWENGHVIQSKTTDLLLRNYFANPAEYRRRGRSAPVEVSGIVVQQCSPPKKALTYISTEEPAPKPVTRDGTERSFALAA